MRPTVHFGREPMTFQAFALPPGLTIDPSGEITGVVETPGTYDVALAVSDGAGDSTTANGTLVVAAPQAIQVSVVGLPQPEGDAPARNVIEATVGDALLLQARATLGVETYTYARGADSVTWVSVDASTGEVTGTVPTNGDGPVFITATDANGNTASIRVWIEVIETAQLQMHVPSVTSPRQANIPDGTQFVATGGTPPYTYTVLRSPTGVGTSTATRSITGPLPPAVDVLWVEAVDSLDARATGFGLLGVTGDVERTGIVEPEPTRDTTQIEAPTDTPQMECAGPFDLTLEQGGTLNAQLLVDNLVIAGIYSLISAPVWVSVDSLGRLMGKAPSDYRGEFVVVWRVQRPIDQARLTCSTTVRVLPGVNTLTCTIPDISGVAGTDYANPVTVTGGTPPYLVTPTIQGTAFEGGNITGRFTLLGGGISGIIPVGVRDSRGREASCSFRGTSNFPPIECDDLATTLFQDCLLYTSPSPRD